MTYIGKVLDDSKTLSEQNVDEKGFIVLMISKVYKLFINLSYFL